MPNEDAIADVQAAIDAVQHAMTILEEAGGQSSEVVKCARAIGDLHARKQRLQEDEEQPRQEWSKQRREFEEALIVAMQGTEAERQAHIDSIRRGMDGDKGY